MLTKREEQFACERGDYGDPQIVCDWHRVFLTLVGGNKFPAWDE